MALYMSTEPIEPAQPIDRRREISSKRLWFGAVGAACCWVALGITDVLITWRECLHVEQYGGASRHPGLLTLNIVLFFVLLAIAIAAGVLSYRTWRRLTGNGKLSNAEGYGSREYMALIGVLITSTVAIGMIWLGIPLMILSLCVRTR
jgi:hypothetical protein